MKAEERVQGRYRLTEPLGHGGMAEVWLAHDERLERDVAIKFMAAHLCDDAEFLVRFFSEAQAVARISHPNVVSVLDFGDFEERPFLVMELVRGGALSDETGAPMLPERAAAVVAGAARGAGAAHRAGLVHRDVKPANILLDETGEPKLTDFGIASSAAAEKLTATGTAIGSPHYISPEQASAGEVTAASDVYSLGAVLYELLTGRPPFVADNVTAIAIAHVEQPPVPPSALVEGLPDHLDAIVLACLAKEPSARPQDGSALADALEREAAPSTAVAPVVPEDDLYAEERPPARRLAPTLVAILLLLVVGGVLYAAGRPDEIASADPDRPSLPVTEKPERARPSRSGEVSAAPVAAAVSTPSPSPTPEPEEEDATPAPEDEEEEDDEPLWTPDPSEEPEPTPEPTPSEPATTPSPGGP